MSITQNDDLHVDQIIGKKVKIPNADAFGSLGLTPRKCTPVKNLDFSEVSAKADVKLCLTT